MRKVVYVDGDTEISFSVMMGDLHISIDNGGQSMTLFLCEDDVKRLGSDIYDFERELRGDE